MNTQPLRNFLLVEQDAEREDVSPAGIVIAATKGIVESQRQLGRRGTVVAIGPECVVAIGDRILYGEFAHREVRENGKTYIALQDADIVGVIEEE